MKKIKTIFPTFIIFLIMTCNSKMINAEELPLSTHGYQATIIKLEGITSSKALAVGEVKQENAKESCERDAGGDTIQYGGKLTIEQCIQEVLKNEKGKLYSISADCPRKTITATTVVDRETFTAIGKDSFGYYIWRENRHGNILDGSSASGAPILGAQFQLLCLSVEQQKELEKSNQLKVNRLNLKLEKQQALNSAKEDASVTAPDNLTKKVSPSFDCKKATTPTEITICTNPELAALDVENMAIYKQAKTKDAIAAKDLLKKSIKSKNACGINIDCIRDAYKTSIMRFGCVGTTPKSDCGIK